MHCFSTRRFGMFLAAVAFSVNLYADPIPVRHPQGAAHGFIVLKTLEGRTLAIGDVTSVLQRDRVISRLIFHFHDGSIDEDTTVFSQHGVVRLISDHHIQHGPSFPKATDVLIDATTGQITSHTEDGKITQDHLDLPPDVSNGLPPNLLLNIDPATPETIVSYVAPTAKPRLVHLSIKPAGKVVFTLAGTRRKATDFIVHVDLGGFTGVIAPLIGKQPDDYHILIDTGLTPAIIREEGQFYLGGPIWRAQQISPAFPR